MEAVRYAYLHQHVTVATRFRVWQRTSTLDLILTKDENMVNNLEVHSPLGNSDHGYLKFHLVCCRERKVQPRKMYLYDEGNYSSMKEELAGDTLLTVAEGDPDAMYDIFCKKILKLQERHIPTRIINGPSKHKAYRLTPIEKKSIKKKHRSWQRYMETKDKNKYAEFARARNKVKAISKRAQKELERNICGKLKDNPKRFGGYLKSRTRSKVGYPTSRDWMGMELHPQTMRKQMSCLNISRMCTYANRQGPFRWYYTPK